MAKIIVHSPYLVGGVGTPSQFGIVGTNYVGPDYSAGKIGGIAAGSSVSPTSVVDEAARQHDIAYESLKSSSTPERDALKADLTFLTDVSQIMNDESMSEQVSWLAKLSFFFMAFNTFFKTIPAAIEETNAAVDVVGSPVDGGIG